MEALPILALRSRALDAFLGELTALAGRVETRELHYSPTGSLTLLSKGQTEKDGSVDEQAESDAEGVERVTLFILARSRKLTGGEATTSERESYAAIAAKRAAKVVFYRSPAPSFTGKEGRN